MFFILSKILSFLLQPVNWLIIGACLWFIIRKNKRLRKWIGIGTVAIFLLFSNRFIYTKIGTAWQYPAVWPSNNITTETGVLLTGMTFTDLNRRSYFGASADRFIQTAELLHLNKIRQVIISGGDASLGQKRPKEAIFLADEMAKLSIPPNKILVESKSRNTYENALFTAAIMDSLSIKSPVMLITSAIHMRRAIACFEKQHIRVIPWPANFEFIENPITLKSIIVPDLTVLIGWNGLLKETVGMLMYKITGKA